MRRSGPRIWPAPILVGVVTIVFLVVALVEDGTWDLISCLILALVGGWVTYKGFTVKA